MSVADSCFLFNCLTLSYLSWCGINPLGGIHEHISPNFSQCQAPSDVVADLAAVGRVNLCANGAGGIEIRRVLLATLAHMMRRMN